MTLEDRRAAYRDPWQWLHDSGFSWDDVNAVASILDHVGLDIRPEPCDRCLHPNHLELCGAPTFGIEYVGMCYCRPQP